MTHPLLGTRPPQHRLRGAGRPTPPDERHRRQQTLLRARTAQPGNTRAPRTCRPRLHSPQRSPLNLTAHTIHTTVANFGPLASFAAAVDARCCWDCALPAGYASPTADVAHPTRNPVARCCARGTRIFRPIASCIRPEPCGTRPSGTRLGGTRLGGTKFWPFGHGGSGSSAWIA